jgi:spore photoproduct lyase
MIDSIYVESEITQHPRVTAILQRFQNARIIECNRYTEVFNPKSQNFRLQKQHPSLILAKKHQKFVLPTPSGYGIGMQHNYYFSHMLNCLYDCRYCFLQGMYRSANYVLFVNYEDFQQQILEYCSAAPDQEICFFSGYDCDSLAFEPVTGFVENFLPFFAGLNNAWLELRTKSTQIRLFQQYPVLPRCVVAFSLAPETIANKLENKAPSLSKRLEAIRRLQNQGWPIGLRFDPLIYQYGYEKLYSEFFDEVFASVKSETLHSVSLGIFRLPEPYFKQMIKLYPDEKLFASPLKISNGMVSYQSELENGMLAVCTRMLLKYIPDSLLFPCKP